MLAHAAEEHAAPAGWHERHLKALLESDSDAVFVAELARIARDLGFEYCAYTVRLPVPVTLPRVVSLANYSQAWQQRYSEQNYSAIDPTLTQAAKTLLPLVWSEPLFAQARPFREDARAHGLAVGWSQACYDASGVCGILSLARSHKMLARDEISISGHKMSWLAQVAHAVMCPRLLARFLPEAAVSLTAREADVLRWSADGRTSAEISTILNITERTVNFHINNSMGKLNATNKTAAVVKAIMLGLL